ncbi:MAG: hypothetical protein [Thorarchaeia virus VerdaV2]|uniref:Uncharacterized protein n=1 Tax=Thorarchaeia virus VerdaV2 TaxID=3070171 RepID=A0AA35CRK7_9CAUD|nr:MAG: hypothetical protein QIT42_gp16 [Thorarchaeia virus VerdaV2]BDI54910.1 MAG: hypothetical protein [Thorarchaeia virus VerdaV2]
MRAFIVHKAEPWNLTVGSLLLLFKDFGYKIWLNPRQIENYDELNHDDHYHEQEIEVLDDIGEMIRIGILQKKLQLLKYKKGAKI